MSVYHDTDALSHTEPPTAFDDGAVLLQQSEGQRLVRALERARGFNLYFVRCDVPVYRREAADELKGHLRPRPVVEVDLSEVDRDATRPSLDASFQAQLADAPEDAIVFVLGMEHTLPYALESRLPAEERQVTRHTLTELNWRRQTFSDIGRPLVVWLPQYALRDLARHAPDFFDWNSGIYELTPPEERRPQLITQTLDDLEGGDSLAELTSAQKRHREAYLRALLDELHPEQEDEALVCADVLHRLGYLLHEMGRDEEALPLYEQALEVVRRKLGERHPAVAMTLNNLAGLYRAQGRQAEALPLYEQALEVYEETLNEAHPHVATTLDNLAGLYEAQGRTAEALPLYERALALRRKALDDEHPLVAKTLNNLAGLYCAQERYAEAVPLYEQALEAYKKSQNATGAIITLGNLGVLAVQADERLPEGLALVLVSWIMLNKQGHRHAEQFFRGASAIASRLGYDQAQFEEAIQEAVTSIQRGGEAALLKAAFPDWGTASAPGRGEAG